MSAHRSQADRDRWHEGPPTAQPEGPARSNYASRNGTPTAQNLHRFHAGFLDYAGHAGFLPRLCKPYRAKTKGKVERFIGYLKGSFWIPFVASCRQAGLKPDKQAANAAVGIWLRDVANARVHATTGEVPAQRMIIEQGKLQELPRPYKGRTAKELTARSMTTASRPHASVGYQHPLSTYEALLEPASLEAAA